MRSHYILLLACLALFRTSLSQAPFDYDNFCRTNFRFANEHIFPANWKILLDSFDYENLIGAVWEPVDFDEDEQNWQERGGVCQYGLRTCTFDADQEQHNWVFTQYVSYEDAQEVIFDITFRFTQCTGNPSCHDDHALLYIFEVPAVLDQASRLNPRNYELLKVLQQEGSSNTNVEFSIPRSSNPNIKGFYLGFEDIGTCGQITRLLSYHLRAPGFRNEASLVTCPDTALPPRGTSELSTTSCRCDANAVSLTPLERSCDVNGVCSGRPECACRPGYELGVDGTCTICPVGTFKATVSNTERCNLCPLNSASFFEGSEVCPCDCNAVRPANQPGNNCGPPPSSPLVANGIPPVNDNNGVTIFWYPALENGGNPETLHYNVYTYDLIENVYIKDNEQEIKTDSKDDLIEYTLNNMELRDSSTLSIVVTSATVVTDNEETISNLSLVQNRFILLYVSFEKQSDVDDTTIDLVGIPSTTETTITIEDPTTKEVEVATTGLDDITTIIETTIKSEDPTTKEVEVATDINTTTETIVNTQDIIPEVVDLPNIIVEPIVSEIITSEDEEALEIIITEDTPNLHFTLGGRKYLNGSILSLSDIGEGDNAILCITDKADCCRSTLEGQFHYPDGSMVPVRAAGRSVYRNRGEGFIRLNFNGNTGTPLGQYRCAIPDTTSVIQSVFITIQ